MNPPWTEEWPGTFGLPPCLGIQALAAAAEESGATEVLSSGGCQPGLGPSGSGLDDLVRRRLEEQNVKLRPRWLRGGGWFWGGGGGNGDDGRMRVLWGGGAACFSNCRPSYKVHLWSWDPWQQRVTDLVLFAIVRVRAGQRNGRRGAARNSAEQLCCTCSRKLNKSAPQHLGVSILESIFLFVGSNLNTKSKATILEGSNLKK